MDDKLSFKRHIKNICRRGKYKLHALQRIRKYLSTDDAKTLCNAFINTQFYYAPLIWMSAGKLLISRVQKKSIFRRYKWFITHMTQLMMNFLSINSDVSIHQKHLYNLYNFNPHFMQDYFKTNFSPYDLRKGKTLHLPLAHSTRHGINSLLFRGSLLSNNLPREIKESLSTEEFKKRLKEHGALRCSCVVCR